MSMFKGFSNAFKIPELRKKILITLGLVAVCRLVSQVPTPGVNWQALQQVIEDIRQNSGGGMLDWFDVFTGGALGQCAIGFLSIWPYISAQIVIQLLSSVIPSLEKLKKEGESGRQRLAQITRYLTIVICVVQSWTIATVLLNPQSLGLGINITSRLPHAISAAYERYFGSTQTSSPVELVMLLVFGFLVVMGTVLLTQGVRKVASHATRRSIAGGNTYGMQQTYMPLRVNYTGVMPIIFAQPILQVLGWLFKKIPVDACQTFGSHLSDMGSATHLIIYAIVIMFFCFFWVATQFNAVDISENLKKDGSYVPGIRPGMQTAEYLDAVMTRITLIGGTGLLIVALLPQILSGAFDIPWAISSFFGGTSLLIIVGVALDTLRIMESHLLVRKYDGFLRHGTLRGRGGV